MDRFHLVLDALNYAELSGEDVDNLRQLMESKLIEHTHYINKHGVDMPEIMNWTWEA